MNPSELIKRLLLLSEQAVDEALALEWGAPENRYIWRELQELRPLAKAALAQPDPQGGEATELARDLRNMADNCDIASGFEGWGTMLIRVAELLEQLQPIKPVPVSERPILKSSDFNDAEGRCWCGTTAFTDERGDMPIDYPMAWELREPCAQDDCVLPHWALPLPTSLEMNP